MNNSRWLNDFEKNVNSQYGEDGILEKIVEIIPNSDKWCVEFGAWDGKFLSNCHNLIVNNSWSSVMIEASKRKFKDLRKTYDGNANVHCINKFVHFEGKNTLDNILSNTPIPKNFDILSVDIDGNDYHIWNSLILHRPKIVIIEFIHSIPIDYEFIQEKNFRINQGSSLLAMNNLAKSKGYELICTTLSNAIFVENQYYELFKIDDNSLEKMFVRPYIVPQIFQLLDGTLMLTSEIRMFWKKSWIVKQLDLQVFPKFLRFHSDNTIAKFKMIFFFAFMIIKRKYKSRRNKK